MPGELDHGKSILRRALEKERASEWVIRKRGYFYRPKRSGYTEDINEAGRYTEQEARAEAANEPAIVSAHLAVEFETRDFEVMPRGEI